jgi:hypothetical protein
MFSTMESPISSSKKYFACCPFLLLCLGRLERTCPPVSKPENVACDLGNALLVQMLLRGIVKHKSLEEIWADPSDVVEYLPGKGSEPIIAKCVEGGRDLHRPIRAMSSSGISQRFAKNCQQVGLGELLDNCANEDELTSKRFSKC